MQKPTQALQSVKGQGNTFDWNPKWARTLPSLIYFYGIFIETPLHNFFFKYQSWYLTSYCGLEVEKPTQALKSVKGSGNTIDINTKWSRTLPSLIYCSWAIYRDHPSIKKIKYQCWYLTPCCGLEVQKPTQALLSVKGPGKTFEWNPKWARTLLSLIYFSWDIHRDPLSIKTNQISKLIFDTQLRTWGTGPGNTFDLISKWSRTMRP